MKEAFYVHQPIMEIQVILQLTLPEKICSSSIVKTIVQVPYHEEAPP